MSSEDVILRRSGQDRRSALCALWMLQRSAPFASRTLLREISSAGNLNVQTMCPLSLWRFFAHPDRMGLE